VKRYPPQFPKRDPIELEYRDPSRPGIRRRSHPVLFPIALILGGLILAASLYYVVCLGIVFIRGMDQD
jgi:hypothetical protein